MPRRERASETRGERARAKARGKGDVARASSRVVLRSLRLLLLRAALCLRRTSTVPPPAAGVELEENAAEEDVAHAEQDTDGAAADGEATAQVPAARVDAAPARAATRGAVRDPRGARAARELQGVALLSQAARIAAQYVRARARALAGVAGGPLTMRTGHGPAAAVERFSTRFASKEAPPHGLTTITTSTCAAAQQRRGGKERACFLQRNGRAFYPVPGLCVAVAWSVLSIAHRRGAPWSTVRARRH